MIAIAARSLRSKSASMMTGIRVVGGSPVTIGVAAGGSPQPAVKTTAKHQTNARDATSV